MKVRCAWHKKTFGSELLLGKKPPYTGKHSKDITDGICDACLNKNFPHQADKIHDITGPLWPKEGDDV